LLVAGCADTKHLSQREQMQQRQEQALNDPFSYGPSADSWDKRDRDQMPTVSGGGTRELDKAALKRDIDHILNP
jgi:N-acetylneuraminic acid mutarotase